MTINDNKILCKEGELIVYTEGDPSHIKASEAMFIASWLFIAAHMTICEHEGREASLTQAYGASLKLVELFKGYLESQENEGDNDD